MKKLTCVTLFVLVVAFLPVLILRGDLWLASDFLHQEIPFILETKRMLAAGAPWWSWNTYLGADFIGSYAFYTLTSPFVWLNCLFPEQWVPYSTALTLVLKFMCMAWLSWLYLRKMGVSDGNSALGAFLFTFSSFNIASLYYYHFYEPIIAFLLLMLAVERLLRGERWGMTLVALAAFAVAFVNFYFAVGSLMAALLYVLFRSFSSDLHVDFRLVLKGVVAVLVGIAMSGLVLLPVLHTMLETTRADAQSAFDPVALLNLLERLRTVFMPKMIEGVTPFVNPGSGPFSNEACIAVFGLSLTCVYVARRRDWLAVLVVALLVFYLTPLNGVFTLFTNPLYTRWAYALTLVIVLCSVRVLDEGTTAKRGVLLYSIVALLVVAAFVAKVMIDTGCFFIGSRVMLQLALFIAGLAVLCLWACGKMGAQWLRVAVVVAVVAQLWLFLLNLHCIDGSGRRGLPVGGGESGGGVTCYRTDFRAPQSDFLALNLGLLRDCAGVRGYHSVISAPMHEFYGTATRDFWSTNKLGANVNEDEFDVLLSVRDVVEIDSAGHETTRAAEHFIPMGFAYDSYFTRSEFEGLMGDTTLNLPLLMLSSVVLDDGDTLPADKRLAHGTAAASLNLDSLVRERERMVATRFEGTSTGYTARVELPDPRVIFFSVPFSEGFTATIDGHPAPIHRANLCMQAIAVPAGSHSIVVEYFPPWLKAGCALSLMGLLFLALIMWSEKKKIKDSSI